MRTPAMKFKKLTVNCTNNPFNLNDSKVTLMKNGAATALDVTITKGTTGYFIATADVSCAVDDEVSIRIITPTGTGNLIVAWRLDYELA